MSRASLAPALLVVALLLSGCAAASAEPSAIEHGAAEEVVAYPVGFPKSDVPMLDGELLHVINSGGIWGAWIASEDPVADLATATALLVDAGYEHAITDPAYGEFVGEDFQLRVVASSDNTYGPSLYYMISPLG